MSSAPLCAGSPSTATVGIVGSGPIAHLTRQAGLTLGVDVLVLTPQSADSQMRAHTAVPSTPDGDLGTLVAAAQGCDVVVLGDEHPPPELLEGLVAAGCCVRPSPAAASVVGDRLQARHALADAGVPVPAFTEAAGGGTLAHRAIEEFAREHGWPVVLKAPRGGYDRHSVEVVADRGAVGASHLAATRGRLLIEAAVPFAVELVVVVARRPSGWWATYPIVEVVRNDRSGQEVVMPARVPGAVADQAAALAKSLADGLDVAGILTLQLLLTADGELVVNEVTTLPRHSSHLTLGATATSPLENHLRGLLDWPLGDTTLLTPAAATVALVGPNLPVDLARALPAALEDPGVRVHLYPTAQIPRRTIGHVTRLAPTHDDALTAARAAAAVLTAP